MLRSLKGKSLLTINDLSPDEIYALLAKAMELKRLLRSDANHAYLEGKTAALIFNKPSTRTRVSFEAGLNHLGAGATYLNAEDLQLGRGETIEDTGKVLSRYVDVIIIRTYKHEDVEKLAAAASVPVINGLTDEHHPCQILADLMTILEKKDRLSGLKLAYLGDGNNVANSLIQGAAKVGMSIYVASPIGYEADLKVVETARSQVKNPRCRIVVTNDMSEALEDADIIYTDVWASMGQEAEHDQRLEAFRPYQVNLQSLHNAKGNAIVMHCLPAHRGEEITDEIIDSPQCVVFDQAENRLHTQKALLCHLLGA